MNIMKQQNLQIYALYNRTVTDSVTGRTHPVFVTLSDGNLSYSIEEDSLFDVNQLYKEGAYETLHPHMMSQMMLIFLLSTLALFGIWGFLIYKKIQKSIEFKKEKEAQIAAVKKEEINLGIDNILQKVDLIVTILCIKRNLMRFVNLGRTLLFIVVH